MPHIPISHIDDAVFPVSLFYCGSYETVAVVIG